MQETVDLVRKWREQETSNPNLDTSAPDDILRKLKTLESTQKQRSELVKDGKLTEGEHARMNALLGTANGQNMWMFTGNDGVTAIITPDDVLPKHTLVFNNCRNCHYTLDAVTVKIFVHNCHNFELTVNERIRTQMLEVYKSEKVNIKVNTLVQTLQIDVCDSMSLHFLSRDHMKDIVWAGTEDLEVSFSDSADYVKTGFSIAQPHYPADNLNFERSQFYVRYVQDQLKIERVIRLTNGFATTTREKEKYELKQTLNVEQLAASMGIQIRAKNDTNRDGLPYSNTEVMAMWNGL